MNNEMKVDSKCVEECLKEYDNRTSTNDMFDNLPIKNINGLIFHISDLSTKDFCEKYMLKEIEDINWD